MNEPQYNIFHDFDCTMITVILGMNLTRNEMIRIANKFLNENGEKFTNSNKAFSALHHSCHKQGSERLQKFLIKKFDNQSRIYQEQIDSFECSNFNKAAKSLLEKIENMPILLWNIIKTKSNAQYFTDYIFHSLLLDKFNEKCKVVVKEKTIIKTNIEDVEKYKKEINNLSAEVAKLNKELLVAENAKEEKTDNNRELRKLRYEIETLKKSENKENIKTVIDNKSCADRKSCLIEEDGCCDERIKECQLENMKIAVVGGISRMRDRYQTIVEKMGAEFYHHDGVCSGGGSRRLHSTICKADIVVYITTINSHNAMHVVKATCKKSGKSFCFMKETSPEMLKNKIAQLAKING